MILMVTVYLLFNYKIPFDKFEEFFKKHLQQR